MKKFVKKIGIPPFESIPLLDDGHLQTIAGRYWPQLPDRKPNASHTITLPDDDKLLVMENRPKQWKPGNRIVMLFHGITGSHLSTYMIRLTRKLTDSGHLVLRVNFRNCGPGLGLSKKISHSGRSEDAREVLKWATQHFPDSPITMVGFSLGGNIILKMAGEDPASLLGSLDSMVAISAPIHLTKCIDQFLLPKNHRFNQHFVSELIKTVSHIHNTYPELAKPDLSQVKTIIDFDEHYTAPYNGFSSLEDYYEQSSSLTLIPSIKIPTLILGALDDPFVNTECYKEIPQRHPLHLVLTEQGGHLAFLGKTDQLWNIRWMDTLIQRWIASLHVISDKKAA